MKKTIATVGMIAILILGGFAVGRYLSEPNQGTLRSIHCLLFSTSIGKIIDNPRDYAKQSVTVCGKVTDVFSFFVLKYFVIRDSAGEIAVVTDRPLPARGTTISVTGTVEEAFSIGDKQLLVIVEKNERS